MKRFLLSKPLLISICLLSCLFFSNNASSQVIRQWVRGPGGTLTVDDLGNAYVLSSSYSASSSYDFVTTKYNTLGTEEWVTRYDGFNGEDYAAAVGIDKAGNVYVTGSSAGNGTNTDIVTIKYNNDGVQQWVVRYDGPVSAYDRASGIRVDEDGNVYIVGVVSTVTTVADFATLKYNTSGVLQWVRYHNGSANGADVAQWMVVDPVTSDVYITGITGFDGAGVSGEDITTIKYNSEGVEQWVRDYKGPGYSYDEARGIALDGQGNVYVTGFTAVPPAPYFLACVTIKYDPSGNMQWTAFYRGTGDEFADAAGIVADKMGNVYITGRSAPNSFDCFTLKYNTAGIQQWVQLYNYMPDGFDVGTAIALDAEGNVYVAGTSAAPITYRGQMTIKYSPDGVQQWVERYEASTASAIAVNKLNDVFVTGGTTIKYIQPKPLIVTASPDTTIYYGYGSNCVPLKAEVSGGVAPYTFTWSPGGTTTNSKTTTVCPTTSSSYTIIVKDVMGTADTAQVNIKAIDVRCGNQKDKVLICHKGEELCISVSAVAAHLQHGDKLGSCTLNTNDCDKLKDITSRNDKLPFIFKASPNPFNHQSTIIYQLPLDAQVTITLVDLNGREIKTLVREKKRAGYYLAFVEGKNLIPGSYLCRMVVGSPPCESVYTLKLIVVK